MDVDSAIVQAARKLGYQWRREKRAKPCNKRDSGRERRVRCPAYTGYGKSLCYALLPLVFDSVRGRPPGSVVRFSVGFSYGGPKGTVQQERASGRVRGFW